MQNHEENIIHFSTLAPARVVFGSRAGNVPCRPLDEDSCGNHFPEKHCRPGELFIQRHLGVPKNGGRLEGRLYLHQG
jgi:hypothetical protein